MKLNSKGVAVLGIGDGPCSVDGRLLRTPGGGASWLTDDTVICQTLVNGEYRVVSMLKDGTQLKIEDDRSINDPNGIAAGSGRWIGWNARDGLFGSLGNMSLAGLRGAGRDGTLAYCRNYQDGRGLVLVDLTGWELQLHDVWVFDLQILGRGQALWFNGNEIACVGISLPRPARPAFRLRRVELVNGEVWLIYWAQDDSGLYAQLDGASDGYILETRPICFRHDAIAVDGQLIVAWSITEGEGPNDLHKIQLDRSKPRVSLKPNQVPIFEFTHPVLVAPFKDPEGKSGAPAEVIINQTSQAVNRPYIVAEDSLGGPFLGERLGVYTERVDLMSLFVKFPRTRLIVGHDDTSDWNITSLRLRPFDIPMLELYFPRTRGLETISQSAARWIRQANDLLRKWPGDCALDPQFYCMGGAPPNEIYTEAEVLDGLIYLSRIVNLSSRFKLILPFAFLRANGVTSHVELRNAFNVLLAEAMRVGHATLIPVPEQVSPSPTPSPLPTSELYIRVKEYVMPQTEIGAINGPGNKFGRVLQADAGKGLFGWYPVLFDRDAPDDDCWFELSKPDTRHKLRHTKVDGLLGADATEHSTSIPKQFYLKPSDDRGILESPVLIHDPVSSLIVGYFTWPDKGVSGPAFTWVKRP